jgi:starch phosphorylase
MAGKKGFEGQGVEARALERARDLPSIRTASDVDALRRAFADHLQFSLGKDEHSATALDRYQAVADAVRDRMMRHWLQTQQTYYRSDAKRIYYLSLEFLMGKALENNLINLGLLDNMKAALTSLGLDLTELLGQEKDAGLGNGGLGRLAACFLDSMATLALPAYGYGIRYEYGIFDQEIRDGWQVERPEEWLRYGNPWEIARSENQVPVSFYGRTERGAGPDDREIVRWVDTRRTLGMAYDTPIAGFRNRTVNTLRLWRARSPAEFDLADFNAGDYLAAVEDKNVSENISKVLYPNDVTVMGKELRLQQQYFFVACSLHDIVSRHLKIHRNFDNFADKVAIQLNDTHPAIAIAELLRIFVDDHGMTWSKAWDIGQSVFGYTNHTLLPEALEKWPVELLGRVLPRHLEIIYDVNVRFLEQVRGDARFDQAAVERMSLVEEGTPKQVRMANLAVVGSHSVNGVAALHTELLQNELFHDFYKLWPKKFNNKTNGVTPRRWILQANPELASALNEVVGPGWITDATELQRLELVVDDAAFRRRFREIKRENKERLAEIILRENGVEVDPSSIFDVQVKRIHEYKRQLLDVLYVVHQYLRMKADPSFRPVPRTWIFAGKAAPGYVMAKWIIKLVNSVASVVNADPDVRSHMKVVFLRNYRVSLAERIFPAADLSEQISTAGKEASGTGNMKFTMNGALTIGTLDGANVEIRDAVGPENFFLFGLTVPEVRELKRTGYNPWDWYRNNPDLRAVIDAISNGTFSPEEPRLFQPVVDSLLNGGDTYLVLADFAAYVAAQERVSLAWLDYERWTRMAILNVARSGSFSSDRTIRQYAEDIWKVGPIPIE